MSTSHRGQQHKAFAWVQALLPTNLQRRGCLKLAGAGFRPPCYHLQAAQPRQLQTMTRVAFFCRAAEGQTQARQPPSHTQVFHSCKLCPGRSAIYSCTVRIETQAQECNAQQLADWFKPERLDVPVISQVLSSALIKRWHIHHTGIRAQLTGSIQT